MDNRNAGLDAWNASFEVHKFKSTAKVMKSGNEPVTAEELNNAVDAAAELFARLMERIEKG